jgi:hypothetical protein
MALVGQAQQGIDLLQETARRAGALLPQFVQFNNFMLSLMLLLGGKAQQARILLPPEPETFLSRWSPNTFWVFVLLIKTGEVDTAAAFLNKLLDMVRPGDLDAQQNRILSSNVLPISALAHTGLALLNHDPAAAATAAELTRDMLKFRNWQADVCRALIPLLIQEPGGEILAPVQNILSATTRGF